MIDIGFAGESDIDELLGIARAFIAESSWPVTFDEPAARMRFEGMARSAYADIIVARDNDRIVGGAVVAIDRDFTVEWWGYLVKFYLLPEWRRPDVALPLIRFCVRWFHYRRCKLAFATATAGIEGGMDTLLRRAGFAQCGPTYVKEFADG